MGGADVKSYRIRVSGSARAEVASCPLGKTFLWVENAFFEGWLGRVGLRPRTTHVRLEADDGPMASAVVVTTAGWEKFLTVVAQVRVVVLSDRHWDAVERFAASDPEFVGTAEDAVSRWRRAKGQWRDD